MPSQICDRQRDEDHGVVFGEDRPGPLLEEQAAPDEENSSDGEADDEETASDGEADERSDTAEASGDVITADVEDEGDGGHAVSSPATAESDSDQATREGTGLERGEVMPTPASRGNSPAPDLAEQARWWHAGVCRSLQ